LENLTSYQIQVPTFDNFGFGERWNWLKIKPSNTYSVWNSDIPATKDDNLSNNR
jgi:hypothetical protein